MSNPSQESFNRRHEVEALARASRAHEQQQALATAKARKLEYKQQRTEYIARWLQSGVPPLAQTAVLVLDELGWPGGFTAKPESKIVRASDPETPFKWYQPIAKAKHEREARAYLVNLVFKPIEKQYTIYHQHEGSRYPARETSDSWGVLLGSDAHFYTTRNIYETELPNHKNRLPVRKDTLVRTDYVELTAERLFRQEDWVKHHIGSGVPRTIEDLLQGVIDQKPEN